MVEMIFQDKTDDIDPNASVVVVAPCRPSQDVRTILLPAEIESLCALIERENRAEKDTEIFTIDTGTRRIVWYVQKRDDASAFRLTGGKLYNLLKKEKQAVICVPSALQAYETAFGLELRSYRFEKYFTKRQAEDYDRLEKVIWIAPNASKESYAPYAALATGVRYARDLTNEPANNMTPVIMAQDIKRLEYLGLEIDILDEKQMHDLEFNLALSVAQGSVNPPRIAVLRWKGRPSDKEFDLGLVGKGVTFDSGGISLKPGQGMWDMKQDMAGAAAVVGAIKTAALQKLPINVVGVVGLVENMPSGSATRPGDIVRSMSGQTVEILNTDAEGRLVLSDCLWYIQKTFGVRKVVDIATLTGAILVALGKEMAGLMSNDQPFADLIFQAGKRSGEELWQLPLTKAYDKMMDSSVADMKNISESRNAGSITAACFLQRFILPNVAWAHLDIAGMDKEDKGSDLTPKGASGFGVRLFNAVMKDLSDK